MYLLSCNVGEIVLLAGAVIAGLPLPLSAVQILYVNLATDGLPALALAVDPPELDLMRRRPRNPRVGIFTRPVVIVLLAAGLWSALVNTSLFTWLLRSGRPLAEVMAMTFVTLVLIQFFNAYNCRSDRLLGVPAAVREPLAERGRRVGACAARHHPVRTLFPASVRNVQHDVRRLDTDNRPGVLDCPGPGSGEVDGAARLVRRTCLTCRCRLPHRDEPLQFLEPVLDDDDLRRGLIGGLFDHQEFLAVGGHVIGPLITEASWSRTAPRRPSLGCPSSTWRREASTRTAMSAPSGAT